MSDFMIMVVGLGGLGAVGIVAWAVVHVAHVWTRTRIRRDILAYVAEGSITPADAASLIELNERAELRRRVLNTADGDTDWDRWRETVRVIFNDDFGKDGTGREKAGASA